MPHRVYLHDCMHSQLDAWHVRVAERVKQRCEHLVEMVTGKIHADPARFSLVKQDAGSVTFDIQGVPGRYIAEYTFVHDFSLRGLWRDCNGLTIHELLLGMDRLASGFPWETVHKSLKHERKLRLDATAADIQATGDASERIGRGVHPERAGLGVYLQPEEPLPTPLPAPLTPAQVNERIRALTGLTTDTHDWHKEDPRSPGLPYHLDKQYEAMTPSASPSSVPRPGTADHREPGPSYAQIAERWSAMMGVSQRGFAARSSPVYVDASDRLPRRTQYLPVHRRPGYADAPDGVPEALRASSLYPTPDAPASPPIPLTRSGYTREMAPVIKIVRDCAGIAVVSHGADKMIFRTSHGKYYVVVHDPETGLYGLTGPGGNMFTHEMLNDLAKAIDMIAAGMPDWQTVHTFNVDTRTGLARIASSHDARRAPLVKPSPATRLHDQDVDSVQALIVASPELEFVRKYNMGRRKYRHTVEFRIKASGVLCIAACHITTRLWRLSMAQHVSLLSHAPLDVLLRNISDLASTNPVDTGHGHAPDGPRLTDPHVDAHVGVPTILIERSAHIGGPLQLRESVYEWPVGSAKPVHLAIREQEAQWKTLREDFARNAAIDRLFDDYEDDPDTRASDDLDDVDSIPDAAPAPSLTPDAIQVRAPPPPPETAMDEEATSDKDDDDGDEGDKGICIVCKDAPADTAFVHVGAKVRVCMFYCLECATKCEEKFEGKCSHCMEIGVVSPVYKS